MFQITKQLLTGSEGNINFVGTLAFDYCPLLQAGQGVQVAQWLAHSLFTYATRVRSSDWAGKYVKWYGYQPGYAPVLRTETVKTEVPCHSECRHVKEPSLLNGHKCRA